MIIHFSNHPFRQCPFFFSSFSSNHPGAKSLVRHGIESIPSSNSSDDLCLPFCLILLLWGARTIFHGVHTSHRSWRLYRTVPYSCLYYYFLLLPTVELKYCSFKALHKSCYKMGQPLSNATIVVAKGLLQGKTFALRTGNALGKILFPLSTVCLCHFVPPVSLIQRDGYAGVGFFRGCTSWVGGGLYRCCTSEAGAWWFVPGLHQLGGWQVVPMLHQRGGCMVVCTGAAPAGWVAVCTDAAPARRVHGGLYRGRTSWVGGGLYRMCGGWWVVLVLLHVGADGGLFRCCTSGAGIGLYSTVQ